MAYYNNLTTMALYKGSMYKDYDKFSNLYFLID